MSFGLRNATQIFQRFIDEVLCDLHFSYVHIIDYVLIASSTPEEHRQHLNLAFDHFRQFGVIINPTKCKLGVSELTFLGHYLNSQGVHPLEDKVIAIQDFLQPTTQHFLPQCADTLKPLHILLATIHKTKITLQWNGEALHAFSTIKQIVTDVSLLSCPNGNAPMNIMTNASNTSS